MTSYIKVMSRIQRPLRPASVLSMMMMMVCSSRACVTALLPGPGRLELVLVLSVSRSLYSNGQTLPIWPSKCANHFAFGAPRVQHLLHCLLSVDTPGPGPNNVNRPTGLSFTVAVSVTDTSWSCTCIEQSMWAELELPNIRSPLIPISITAAHCSATSRSAFRSRSTVFCHARSVDFPLRFPLHSLTLTGVVSVRGPWRVSIGTRSQLCVSFLNLMTLCVDSKLLRRFAFTACYCTVFTSFGYFLNRTIELCWE